METTSYTSQYTSTHQATGRYPHNIANRATAISRNRPMQPGDKLFVTLSQYGRVIVTMCRADFNSFQDIMRSAHSLAGNTQGMTQLSVRNSSQGWTMTLPLLMHAPSKSVIPA